MTYTNEGEYTVGRDEHGVERERFITTPIIPLPSTQYSPLDFRALFTFPELVAFDNSALPYVVTIRENFRAAQYIDLADPRTVAQVQLLATADCGNILTPERMAQVLAGEAP